MTGAYQRCNLFVLWFLAILYRGRENLPAGNSVSWSTGWAQSTERELTSGNNNDRIERGIVKNIPWSWAWVIYASGGQVVCRSIYRPTPISINKNEDKNGIKRKGIKKKMNLFYLHGTERKRVGSLLSYALADNRWSSRSSGKYSRPSCYLGE